MHEKGLSRHAKSAVDACLEVASAVGAPRAGAQHLLVALCELRDSDAYAILKRRCRDIGDVRASLGARRLSARGRRLTERDMTSELEGVICRAKLNASSLGDSCVGTEQLLSALLRADNPEVRAMLARAGADIPALRSDVREPEAEDCETEAAKSAPIKKKGVCERYSRDLTLAAQRGELDPVVGRDGEIARVTAALARRKKCNVCLVGDAGVGKTAVAEGLAQRLISNEALKVLSGKRVLALDMASLVAGTKYRGDFEERLRELVDDATARGDVILFIDEIHTVMGAGSAEGTLDAANILKPALARGGFSVIGATTAEEYARFIEKDGAFARRFERVEVNEPDDETALAMLSAQLPSLEAHHGISIEPAAVTAAVKLSRRYLPERRLPDKALDLIEDAAADMRLRGNTGALGARDVARSLSLRRGIPISESDPDGCAELLSLEERLSASVIGQDSAVAAVCAAVRRSRAGVNDPKRPSGCFLLCGPTGTGKTELCRALALELFSDERAFVRLDMSEYAEPNSASRLIGAAPGYVGHELGGALTDAVRRRPYSLVLFDELEKASSETRALLLQIMEEGSLTDSHGVKTDFRNCLVACTSNVCSRASSGASRPTGFAAAGGEASGLAEAAARELEQTFPAELINRFDAIALFRPLADGDLVTIAGNLLCALARRLSGEGYGLVAEEGAARAIVGASEGCEKYGARPLRRAITALIEDPLADMILRGELQKGACARVCASGDEIKVLTSEKAFCVI